MKMSWVRGGGGFGWPCAVAVLVALGCGDGAEIVLANPAARPGDAPRAAKYVAGSVVFSPDGEQSYISILDSLAPQRLDERQAVELPGWADLWVHEGYLFVSNGESPVITKYSVSDDSALIEEATLSFANYGEVDAAFWSNTFVGADKAYMIDGVGGYVIWNPTTMEITGTLELPVLPEREGMLLRAGTLDRSNVIRDGVLYQPMYWSDEDYAVFTPDSRIVAIDIATDTVLNVIDAPCRGLDIGSRDAEGNLYFSTWTSGVYQPLVLGEQGNCVVKVAAGSDTAEAAFSFAGVAGGREGSAVRSFSDGRLLMSIFHDERVDFAADTDPWAVLAESNWRTWLYEPATGSASVVEQLDWNSGATYVFEVDGSHFLLVPSTDYASTSVVALNSDATTSDAFDVRGWGTRLFQLR